MRPFAPVATQRIERGGRDGEGIHVSDDAERRAEHAADLGGVGMDLHDGGAADGGQQFVALGDGVAEAGADGEDQVGLLCLGEQGRVGADAEIAGEVVLRAVEQCLATEADRGGDGVAGEEFVQRAAAGFGPAGAADHRERAV